MTKQSLQITRRSFLKSTFFGALALSFSTRSATPMWQELLRLGIPAPWYKQGEMQISYNYCDMRPWRCGVVVKSVNGRVHKIDGNPADPKSRGMLCARGQAGPSFMYDPDRLRSPMIRMGERGEGQFKEVTWNEALEPDVLGKGRPQGRMASTGRGASRPFLSSLVSFDRTFVRIRVKFL